MSRPEYVLGVDAAVILKYGSVDQSIIKGLNKLKLPDLTREVISIQEFRRDFDIEFTTSGKYGRIQFGGNMVLGDSKGQDQLKAYFIANTKFNDCRLHLTTEHFLTVDLANDEDACFQVASVTPGQADKSGTFALDCEMVCGGQVAYFVKHMTASTIATVATGNKLTDSGNGFVDAGFEEGQTLIIEGTASNDGQALISSVTAGEIVVTGPTLTDEAAGSSITLHGGTL